MKKLFPYILIATGLFACTRASSQNALFLHQGNITFVKTTNVLAVLKDNVTSDNIWGAKMVEAYEKSNNPASFSTQFNLAFNGSKSLYTPIETATSKMQL